MSHAYDASHLKNSGSGVDDSGIPEVPREDQLSIVCEFCDVLIYDGIEPAELGVCYNCNLLRIEGERSKGDDDGVEYGDPRDARMEKYL